MSSALRLHTITRPIFRQTLIARPSVRMASSNEYGQGKSHAQGESAVPGKIQEAAPSGLEEALPESVSNLQITCTT